MMVKVLVEIEGRRYGLENLKPAKRLMDGKRYDEGGERVGPVRWNSTGCADLGTANAAGCPSRGASGRRC